jgi:hypothetical protein
MRVRRQGQIIEVPDEEAVRLLPGDEVGFDLTPEQELENADWIKRGPWDVDMPKNKEELLDYIRSNGMTVEEFCALPVAYWHVADPDKPWLNELCGKRIG